MNCIKKLGIGLMICGTICVFGCSNKENMSSTQNVEVNKKDITAPSIVAEEKQNVVILHQAIDGEAIVNPRSCSVIPACEMDIYLYPDEKSQKVSHLNADIDYNIVGFELHTFPGKYPFEKDGQKGYLLSYRGEGYYTVLVDNKVKQMQFNNNKQECKADFWICVRDKNGIEGWTVFKNRKDWKMSKFHGMFFQNAYINGTDVNIRSAAGTNSDVIGQFKQYEHITVLESKQVNNKWWNYVVRETGEKGWVSGDFMKYFR